MFKLTKDLPSILRRMPQRYRHVFRQRLAQNRCLKHNPIQEPPEPYSQSHSKSNEDSGANRPVSSPPDDTEAPPSSVAQPPPADLEAPLSSPAQPSSEDLESKPDDLPQPPPADTHQPPTDDVHQSQPTDLQNNDQSDDLPPTQPPIVITEEEEHEEKKGGGEGGSGGGLSQASNEAVEEELEEKDEDIYYGMTPKEMIRELDRFVIGQEAAKKAVAIAWRARWRRQKLPATMHNEVLPKNILMIGPTGVGKTEVARRLARVSRAPFVKVEATKFTEVGYVGKDVNSIIEDLVANAATLVKKRKMKKMEKQINKKVEDIILKLLMGKSPLRSTETFRKQLRSGQLDNFKVQVKLKKEPELPYVPGKAMMILSHNQMLEHTTETKMLSIVNARKVLTEQESKNLLSDKDVAEEAVKLAENDGIVFIDEIDKICGSRGLGRGEHKVSQEGVQRDLLPLIEGSSVTVQNFGKVLTDHILFICAGAFHDSKPSDLMPEFQGRLPVRVKLENLSKKDLHRILTETCFNLISQQVEMLKTEDYELQFTDEAIVEIADAAYEVNQTVENIGARRLVTVLEKVLEDINLEAPEQEEGERKLMVDLKYIQDRVGVLLEKSDYKKYVL